MWKWLPHKRQFICESLSHCLIHAHTHTCAPTHTHTYTVIKQQESPINLFFLTGCHQTYPKEKRRLHSGPKWKPNPDRSGHHAEGLPGHGGISYSFPAAGLVQPFQSSDPVVGEASALHKPLSLLQKHVQAYLRGRQG